MVLLLQPEKVEESEGKESAPQQFMMACPQEGYKLFPENAGGSRVCEEELEAHQYPRGSGVMAANILRMTLEKLASQMCCVGAGASAMGLGGGSGPEL